ncbi:hypothetical protein NEDG_01298 [Nematocida displodere]|uniref:Uncharacterized protein n=1 Tax=Nematocida displodere TaxID=1805483 RepID=A0A177EBB4_9MICR|nr:hypothetical protein NEDG_01298 [Nematocida displodere]
MSQEAAKKRVLNNTAVMKRMIIAVAVANVLAKLIKIPLGVLLTTLFIETSMLGLMFKLSGPSVVTTGGKVEIRSEGLDLSSRGMSHILKDTCFISLAVKLSSKLAGKKAFFILLLVPVTIYYELTGLAQRSFSAQTKRPSTQKR